LADLPSDREKTLLSQGLADDLVEANRHRVAGRGGGHNRHIGSTLAACHGNDPFPLLAACGTLPSGQTGALTSMILLFSENLTPKGPPSSGMGE